MYSNIYNLNLAYHYNKLDCLVTIDFIGDLIDLKGLPLKSLTLYPVAAYQTNCPHIQIEKGYHPTLEDFYAWKDLCDGHECWVSGEGRERTWKYYPESKEYLADLLGRGVPCGRIDVAKLDDMSDLFSLVKYKDMINFAGIGSWNMSHVTDTSRMFVGVRAFNNDISSWDMSKVRYAKEMFKGVLGPELTDFAVGDSELDGFDWKTIEARKKEERPFLRKFFKNNGLAKWDMPSCMDVTDMFVGSFLENDYWTLPKIARSDECTVVSFYDDTDPEGPEREVHIPNGKAIDFLSKEIRKKIRLKNRKQDHEYHIHVFGGRYAKRSGDECKLLVKEFKAADDEAALSSLFEIELSNDPLDELCEKFKDDPVVKVFNSFDDYFNGKQPLNIQAPKRQEEIQEKNQEREEKEQSFFKRSFLGFWKK